MANKEFDRYRESLVVETRTIWPDELADLDEASKARLAQRLHADPENATSLDYHRMHSGFTRVITVTADDVARIK